MPRALVFLAPGAEELETVAIVDVLRRAGVEVTLAGVQGPQPVLCSRRISLVPDCGLKEARGPYDLLVCPGGAQGAETLAADPSVRGMLKEQDQAGRLVAAICAAPIVLVAAEAGKGRKMTCYPAPPIESRVAAHGRLCKERVVRDGHVLTSRGPGTALEFALALVSALLGDEAARKVAGPMLAEK